MQRKFIIIGSILAALAVILGAFGAHSLETQLTTDELLTYETGTRYHFYHVFAIFLVALLYQQFPKRLLSWAGWLFVVGILLFSGSIYLLATSSITGISTTILGPLTPLGGLLFIVGWILVGVAFFKK